MQVTDFTVRKIESKMKAATASINEVASDLKNTERGLLFSVLEGYAVTNYRSATGHDIATSWAGKTLSFRAYRNAAKVLMAKGLIQIAYTGPATGNAGYLFEPEEGIGGEWHFYGRNRFMAGIEGTKPNDATQRSTRWVCRTDTQMAALFLSDMSNADLKWGTTESDFYSAFKFVPAPHLAALYHIYESGREMRSAAWRVRDYQQAIEQYEHIEATPEESLKAQVIAVVASAEGGVEGIRDAVAEVLRSVTTPEQVERNKDDLERKREYVEQAEEAVTEWLAAA